jgi:hypothetical protein
VFSSLKQFRVSRQGEGAQEKTQTKQSLIVCVPTRCPDGGRLVRIGASVRGLFQKCSNRRSTPQDVLLRKKRSSGSRALIYVPGFILWINSRFGSTGTHFALALGVQPTAFSPRTFWIKEIHCQVYSWWLNGFPTLTMPTTLHPFSPKCGAG